VTAETSTDAAAPVAVEVPWRRLDRRMLVVSPIHLLVRVVPFVAVLLLTGQGDITRIWFSVGATAVVVLAGVLRFLTTRYRITAERVELHTGWLRRERRSVPRDRIRTVDLTASPLHRAFGLNVVRVSAGAAAATGRDSGLNLDAVSKVEGERLRRELLDRSSAAAAVPDQPAARPADGQVLARLRWSWLRFAPLTFSSLAGIGVIVATAFNLVDDLGIDPRRIDAVGDTARRLAAAPIWVGIGIVGVVLLVVAVVGASLMFAERWYAYRLTREPDATLRVHRGLLTRRSLSVAEERLRGAEVVEPVLLRAGRGAQSRALTTGLDKGAQGGVLQPPVPRAEAHRVASAVLRVAEDGGTRAPLLRHPRVALSRRLTRALLPAIALVAAAFLVGRLTGATWLLPTALVALPVAALLGWDRYRSLGHALTGGFLVTRNGSLVRRTVALQRPGVIGWTVRQTIFQRRAGLVSLEAVTAAGHGGYTVTDVAAADAVELADAAVPDLLAPFRPAPFRPAPGPSAPAAGAEHAAGDLPTQRTGR
jgi:putative membrane protein